MVNAGGRGFISFYVWGASKGKEEGGSICQNEKLWVGWFTKECCFFVL